MTNEIKTGWMACEDSDDCIQCVRHGAIRTEYEHARQDQCELGFPVVRWVSSDGFLYVDKQVS